MNYKLEWDNSYRNRDNFVFYPNEEIIRFTAKYIAKRVGLEEIEYRIDGHQKVLDLGCGIGRHLVFLEKLGVESYGIDLSENAVKEAKKWLQQEGILKSESHIYQGSATELPWKDCYFQYIISHGVLDSMPKETAKQVIKEAHRVVGKDGLFYCDLIGGNTDNGSDYDDEEIVTTAHENGTIQSYFTISKIREMFGEYFTIEECKLIKYEDCLRNTYHSRYHIVFKKIN